MKKGEKYTMLISEREAGLVLVALEFALKLKELLPFSEEQEELVAARSSALGLNMNAGNFRQS
ncbi:MAG: hypothetical protein ACLSE8_02330 [Parasutterella sp.]